MKKQLLAVATLALVGAACGGAAKADPDIRLHPRDVRGMPVLWLGEEFDSDGDGTADMKLTSAYLKHSREHVINGQVVKPEVKFYSLAYGDCDIPPGATGCPIPVNIDIAHPCDAHPVVPSLTRETLAIRGIPAERFGDGSLQVQTDDFTLTIHAVAETPEKSVELAQRIANELRGANPEAAEYGRDTAFKARASAYRCR